MGHFLPIHFAQLDDRITLRDGNAGWLEAITAGTYTLRTRPDGGDYFDFTGDELIRLGARVTGAVCRKRDAYIQESARPHYPAQSEALRELAHQMQTAQRVK